MREGGVFARTEGVQGAESCTRFQGSQDFHGNKWGIGEMSSRDHQEDRGDCSDY